MKKEKEVKGKQKGREDKGSERRKGRRQNKEGN